MSLLPEFDAMLEAQAAPDPPAPKWTERMVLDALHGRYSQNPGNGPRYVVAEHVRNQAGFGGYWNGPDAEPLRTADAIAIDLWPSGGNLIHGHEVKVSRSDWLAELRDPAKSATFRRYCHHWWLVVPDASIVRDDLPPEWGLLVVGKNGRIRQRVAAPRLNPEPITPSFLAALLRATARTAKRRSTDARD